MSQVVSFAEESCWDGDRFRSVRREIVFVLMTFVGGPEKSVRREFRADFGLWYDVDDEWLLDLLRREEPTVDWGYYIYFKKLDHSAILIHHPDSGEVVGVIYPRGRTKRKLSREINGANVVPIAMGRTIRAARLARKKDRAKKRREQCRPTSS